jgi:hypothetical protein
MIKMVAVKKIIAVILDMTMFLLFCTSCKM